MWKSSTNPFSTSLLQHVSQNGHSGRKRNDKQQANYLRCKRKQCPTKSFQMQLTGRSFSNLKKSQLIYHSDVKAAIHQNEDIILNIERKNVSQTLQFTLI